LPPPQMDNDSNYTPHASRPFLKKFNPEGMRVCGIRMNRISKILRTHGG